MSRTEDLLARLVAQPTVSLTPNAELIAEARSLLEAVGAECWEAASDDGSRINLFATIGPRDRRGVMLSGHTDVVPVEGQDWSADPFRLREEGGRLYGRGTADMKGFVAASLAAAERAAGRELATPLHLALSYDEEIGCIGVRRMIDALEGAPVRPLMCIVGEPTSLAVATGHKGKRFLKAHCRGREGHSALAPFAFNALHLAADLVVALRAEQAHIAAEGPRDGDYDVPYTTVHTGRVTGGVALNIVPNAALVEFEIRNLAGDPAEAILDRIEAAAAGIVADAGDEDAAIRVETANAYPGLDTPTDADVVNFVKGLTGQNGTIKVAFGTEGGLFSERLGIPTVICGPGSMMQGHKPDEFVTREQLARCDAMLDALIDRLAAGL